MEPTHHNGSGTREIMTHNHITEAQFIGGVLPNCNAPRQAQQVCIGDTMRISCRSGFYIDILDANYGRSTPGICVDTPGTKGNCYTNQRSIYIMKERCEGRQSCDVLVSEEIFDREHCTGVSMYLDVNYFCKPNACKVILTTTQSTMKPITTSSTTKMTTMSSTAKSITTASTTKATTTPSTTKMTTTASTTKATTMATTTKAYKRLTTRTVLSTPSTTTLATRAYSTTNDTTTNAQPSSEPPRQTDHALLSALIIAIVILVVIAVVLVITCKRLRNPKQILTRSEIASFNSSGSGGQTVPKYLSLCDSSYTIPNEGSKSRVILSTDKDGYLNPYQPLRHNGLSDIAFYESLNLSSSSYTDAVSKKPV